jgi:carboxyvinyl-carboxyphosphonate phosphorylmutase
MNWTHRRERFRALLTGSACVHPASVFDAISARLALDLGFEMGMFAGSIASMAVLGAPDVVVLTLTEFAEQAYRISRGADLPLMVDADHGYGNALNVKRTVEELETAGVSALTIEDTRLPTVFGSTGKSQLISIEEGVGKMKAALAGRQDKTLAVVGRTSAAAMTGIDDTIARVRAYEAAGVDAVFLAGLRTRAELDAIAPAVHVPLLLGGVTAELADRSYLAGRGVRICLQGHQPFMAAVRAVHETLKALREGTLPAALPGIASSALLKQATRQEDYDRWSKEFLGG